MWVGGPGSSLKGERKGQLAARRLLHIISVLISRVHIALPETSRCIIRRSGASRLAPVRVVATLWEWILQALRVISVRATRSDALLRDVVPAV